MKKLELYQMEKLEGGKIPKGFVCAAAIAGTALFIGGLFAVSGPIGLYAANAILGPAISGLAIGACVTE